MQITTIEAIPLRVPYEDRIRKAFYHFGMTEEVTVYKFHTDTGLVGLGENPGPPFEQSLLDAYLGTNPFDHVMGTGRFNLDMACYDLMGKHLGLPAWKLMGQQVREWVSMGWWMPCMSPEDSAGRSARSRRPRLSRPKVQSPRLLRRSRASRGHAGGRSSRLPH